LKVPQLSQLVNVCNPPKSEEICDKMMEILSDGTVKFEILMLNPTSFPLDVIIFKDGIDLRKLATPGLNVMATEFSPQPLDLVKMLSDMSEGKIKKLKEVEVEVEREDGDVSLELEKEPMECDPAAFAQEVEKEMEEGFKTEDNKMEEGPAPDALIPAETVDKTEKIADSVEKMEEVNIPADVVEKEEMNVSTDNVEKEDEMIVSETEVKETTPVKQEKVEPPVSEEEVGDAATEEEQSRDDTKPEGEIPTAPEEEIEKNEVAPEVATETSVANDDADYQQVEDAAEELDEEIETSVIENPAVTTEAIPEVISEEKLEVAAEEFQRDEGDLSLDVEIEKEQMECDPASAKEVENEATPENIEQPKVHTPEKEELVVEKTESPTKEDTPGEEDKKTPPFSKSIEFSSPEACPGMDHSSFLMDSDIALQNSDAESHSSFTFQVPLPVRLFGNDDKTSSAHSSNMSLDSMDNRGGNQATQLEERMPQNGGGDADEVS
jgi:hypothetical protein